MDSAVDSLLALSNTAAALAAEEQPEEEDDRSSSLSELEDGNDVAESDPVEPPADLDGDSEAETERLEESPVKVAQRKAFGISPSKLAQSVHVDDDRSEIESLSDSAISSPISSGEESLDEDALSDGPGAEEESVDQEVDRSSPNKRKREDNGDDTEQQTRSRRRRTGSAASEEAKSDPESEDEERRSQPSREASADPEADLDGQEDEIEEDEDQQEGEKADISEDSKSKARGLASRSSRRKTKEEALAEADPDGEDEADVTEDSDIDDGDDAEVVAKSEEEQAKKLAAMEALTALEKHFAVLRDRLYDERIAAINQELSQLAETKPIHSELLRQLECVQKYRDDKFEVEQKLLVYKVGALKNKSVGERSQIHSAYFQTIRDVRERHLERISEHFYRIQRDRFKAEAAIPSYTVPFPGKRSQQIKQQTSYNKEVSILSGVAKYIGFPAAPDLLASRQKEVEDDMQKMGVSISQARLARAPQRSTMHNTFNTTLSGPAAEEQFLEQTPWANPQHPIHRLGLSRQNSSRSPLDDSLLTPANQRVAENAQPNGSASTIPEHPSAPISSTVNTPYEGQSGVSKAEPIHGISGLQSYRQHSTSPLETRRVNSNSYLKSREISGSQANENLQDGASSPLLVRGQQISSDIQTNNIVKAEKPSRFMTRSPFTGTKDAGVTSTGFAGVGRFSVK